MYMCVFCDTMREKVETIYPTSSNVFLNLLSKIDEKNKKKATFLQNLLGLLSPDIF